MQASDKKVTLFCLPFAGGSSYSYGDLHNYTADFIEVIPIELPGRGKRFGEPLLTDMHAIADDAIRQMKDLMYRPCAIYGHSMGACMGYLLVKRLVAEGKPPPLQLFVSGREGPSVPARERGRHVLPQKEFFDVLKEYEGTSAEVLQNRELMELFEPVLRADFQAIDTYVYEETTPFDIPVTVMIGRDEKVTLEDALQWQKETAKKISVREFPGGHFFIYRHLPEIGDIISQCLTQSLSRRWSVKK
ncbi:MAG: alpha/beta fold hydrolase [Dissulfurispiraceae bacterium]|jgi:surfactin synthase thioesterase subunit